MKGQSFHRRKIKFHEAPQVDYSEVKARSVIALDKLGHQKLSTEPGGYSLESWMRGVNLMLDDFERKMSGVKLPLEYAEKRHELNERLSKPPDLSSIDKDISELRQGMADITRKIGEGRARAATRVEDLQDELATSSAELTEVEEQLSAAVAAQRSRPFLRRLFGGDSASRAGAPKDKIKGLQTKMDTLSAEMSEEERFLKSIDQRSPGSPFADGWRTLDSMEIKLKELEEERLQKEQFVKEREDITASIASTISTISPVRDEKPESSHGA